MVFALLLMSFSIGAKAQLKIDAQYRSRLEFRDGYQKLAAEGSVPAFFISQRARLSFSYDAPNFRIKISPQDVRVWGDQANMSSTGPGDNPSFDLLEGYAELKLGKAGWVTIGRQQLKYDNELFLGARNWGQAGMAYDAVVFKLKLAEWNLHFGSSWNSMAENLTGNLYPASRIKSVNFLWLNGKVTENLTLSLLHIASGATQTDTTSKLYFKQTSGIYATYKNENFSFWGDAYYQYGKTKTDMKISAFLAQAEAGYKLRNITPGIGYGYVSGNSVIGSEMKTDHVIDNLYGTRHRYFGLLDYFRNYSSGTKQGGVTDLNLFIDYRISKTVNIRNAGHFLALAQTNTSTPEEKYLGYENDILVNYKFADWGALEGGYFFIVPTDALRSLQGVTNDKHSHYFFIMLTISPTIFKQAQ
jgi:hypothetical protein